MFFLSLFIWFACMVAVAFTVVMSAWIWRTRPAAVERAERMARRVSYVPPPVAPSPAMRLAVDGRRRDLAPVRSW